MTKHPKIKTLVDNTTVESSRNLSEHLRHLFDGDITFPQASPDSPYVVANFVKTTDGLISYSDIEGRQGGGDISGFNTEDVFIMGLLRTLADAILVGANTLRIEPEHKWTPEYIFPDATTVLKEQREKLNKGKIINSFTTLSGDVPFDASVFHDPAIISIIFTGQKGAEKIASSGQKPDNVIVEKIESDDFEKEALKILSRKYNVSLLLVEGGPRVFGSFLEHQLIDEVWLSESPYLGGNNNKANRPTLVMGTAFHPDKSPKLSILSEKGNIIKNGNIGNYRYFRYKVD